MEALTESNGFDTSEENLDRLRLRIFDTASKLKPLATVEELSDRIRAVVAELHVIEEELLLVAHIREIEATMMNRLEEIDTQLAAGWQPAGSDVDDVIKRLRSSI